MEEITFRPDLEAIKETGIAISKNLTVRFLGSTDSLDGSGADLLPNDQQNQSIRTNSNHDRPTRINAETAAANEFLEPAGDNTAHH